MDNELKLMQKQKKFKKNSSKKVSITHKRYIIRKKHIRQVKKFDVLEKRIYRRFRKLYKNTTKLFLNHKHFVVKHLKIFRLQINIKIKSNNIFCSLKNKKLNKVLKAISSGIYRIKTSKKNIKNTFKNVLRLFLNSIEKKVKQKKKNLIIKLIAPSRIRKRILKYVLKNLKLKIKNGLFLFKLKEKKCFNGCKPRKQRKKKRKGFRIFK